MPRVLGWASAAFLSLLLPGSAVQASPLFELVGAGFGSGGFSARASGPSAASTYFNPGLLPRAKQGLDVGWFVLNDAIGISLDPRPAAVDIPTSAVNRVRTQTPPVPSDWLANGCSAATGACTRDLPAQPRQSEGSSGTVRAYQMLGLVNHLLDGYLSLGFYAIVPLNAFTQAHSFFVDEREQFATNSLHPELYADRLTPVSLSFGAGSRLSDWFSFGLSFTLGLSNDAHALAYVGDSSRLDKTLGLSTKVDVSASVSPHLGFVFTPVRDLDLSLTLHSPQKMVIETGFGIYLPNGDVQRATRRSTHSFVPWIVGLGGSYKLAQHTRNAWELTGTLGYERWSRYVNRQSDRPSRDYAWRDVPSAALGVRLTHDTRLTGFFDVNFRPSPVPRQTGRTNYVDNDRYGLSAGVHYELPIADWQIALRFGAQLQLHILPERRQTKLDPSAAGTDGARSQRVLDEWPDDSVDVATGEQIAEAQGLQTNNPGYPGYASRGLILGGGASISLLY